MIFGNESGDFEIDTFWLTLLIALYHFYIFQLYVFKQLNNFSISCRWKFIFVGSTDLSNIFHEKSCQNIQNILKLFFW